MNGKMRTSLGHQAADHARTGWSGAEMSRRMLELYQATLRRGARKEPTLRAATESQGGGAH